MGLWPLTSLLPCGRRSRSPSTALLVGPLQQGDGDQSLSRLLSWDIDIIREYFALRKEMLSAINSPEAPGGAHVGLVHSLVARMGGRLAVLLTERDDELIERQRRIEWMVDRLALMYLIHTREVNRQPNNP